MFKKEIYKNRRVILQKNIKSGLILLMGNEETGMNYKDNTFRFRQDSTFLYYLGIDIPHVAAVIDVDENKTILFGNDLSIEYVVWMGPQPTMSEQAAKTSAEETRPYNDLKEYLEEAKSKGRDIHFLPPYRTENMLQLEDWLEIPVKQLQDKVSIDLIKAVVAQREIKTREEIIEMEVALAITKQMHVACMRSAKVGRLESELTGIAHGIAVGGGGDLAYPIILTINGQTLHNHFHGNTLQNGQLVLGDFGAESGMHYAGDITRTFPVNQTFTTKQKEIYQIVLDTENTAIQSLKPGITYKEIHLNSAKQMAEGLKSLGIMKGDIEEAVAVGAHGLFFPHGLGHQIGLDVHDMEDLGEKYVGYREGIERSTQFGLKSLRLAKELKEGMVLTVEPGLYFIPELIDMWQKDKKFSEFINYEKVNEYRNFSGVRIEDNCLITSEGSQVLGPPIPKTIEEVENERNNN